MLKPVRVLVFVLLSSFVLVLVNMSSVSALPSKPHSQSFGLSTTRATRSQAEATAQSPGATGLTIVPIYSCPTYSPVECETVASDPDASQIESAVGYAISQFEALYSNPITVYLHINMTTYPGLGTSLIYTTGPYSYATVRNALIANAKTADQALADGNLSPTDPTNGGSFFVPDGEAKALGLLPASEVEDDGDVYFGSDDSYTFDPNDRTVAGDYDFIGLAEHEISEALGRSYGLDSGSPGLDTGGVYMPNDLFRYTASGEQNLTAWTPGAYFSIDDGATNLADFNSNPNGDPQDYVTASPDAFDAYGTEGVEMPLTEVGLTNMDVIGFNRDVSSLSISPSTQDIASGSTETYSAEGYDALGNTIGAVTGSTTFTIAPDGSGSSAGASCTGAVCTAATPGTYLVTGSDGTATDIAVLSIGFAITTTSLLNATPAVAYGPVTLQEAGAGTSVAPFVTTFKWKKVSLPKGLKLSSAGVLSGTPNNKLAASPTSVTAQVTETVTTLNGKKKIKTKTTAEATIPLRIT